MPLRPQHRIVHVTTVHPRHDNRILRKECSALKQHFGDVHLVVADGKGRTDADGIVIHDVGGASNRMKRMLLMPMRAFRSVRSLRPDVVHVHDPELLPMAVILRYLGYKVVYDAHEDLPRAILSKNWIRPDLQGILSTIFEIVEGFCAKRVSAIVSATPHIANRFKAINAETISVSNYPVLANAVEPPVRRPEHRTVAYIGLISRKRAAREIITAIGLADIRLILAGPMEHSALDNELKAMPEWDNVEYHGVVEHDRIWDLMARASAGLLMFHPEPNHINSVPNKMFEYMAGGIPILCSDFQDWRKTVVDDDIGMTCDPLDPHAIAALMRRIVDDPEAAEAMGRRGRKIVMEKYRWENEAAKLVALYERLLGDKAEPGAAIPAS